PRDEGPPIRQAQVAFAVNGEIPGGLRAVCGALPCYTTQVRKALVIHGVPRAPEAEYHAIGAAGELHLVQVAHACAVVAGSLLDHLNDRVPQVLVAVAKRGLERACIEIEHRTVRDAIRLEIALVPAGHVAGVRA